MVVIVESVVGTPWEDFGKHPGELVPEMVIKVAVQIPEHEAHVRHNVEVVPENLDAWGDRHDVNEPPF